MLDELPGELDEFGSPAASVMEMAGTWTNGNGDTLVLELSTAGRFHRVSGTPRSSSGVVLCAAASYIIELEDSAELTTPDGQFDERLPPSVRLHP